MSNFNYLIIFQSLLLWDPLLKNSHEYLVIICSFFNLYCFETLYWNTVMSTLLLSVHFSISTALTPSTEIQSWVPCYYLFIFQSLLLWDPLLKYSHEYLVIIWPFFNLYCFETLYWNTVMSTLLLSVHFSISTALRSSTEIQSWELICSFFNLYCFETLYWNTVMSTL